MNGIIADTTAITVAPKGMIERAIGMGTETGIEMTTETGEIHVETEMTRTETGADLRKRQPELSAYCRTSKGCRRGAQKHEATNNIVGVN
jgi:hypothetical protein